MMSLSEMLTAYNEKAPEFNLKTRKSFRNRKEAFEALIKVGIAPPEPDPDDADPEPAAATDSPEPEPASEEVTSEGDDGSSLATFELPDQTETESVPKKKKTKAKSKAKKAAAKKPAKKAAKKKAKDTRRMSEDDNGALGLFQILRGSKQHRVLEALLKGEPLSMKKLSHISGSSLSATAAIVGGINAKTKGQLLRGGKRPPYKLIKSKEGGELIIALIKEK